MTVQTLASAITVAATGASSYIFPFIGVSAADIGVIYTNALGTQTTLPTTAYSVSINAPLTGQVWGLGGTISPSSPSSFTSGTLTIGRILPLTQTAEISNQGNQYPIVTEEALDILCMEIQQVSARGGAFRGVWATNIVYNFGDIVVDGINGSNTTNWYLCTIANTSVTWVADLANGDWSLILNIQSIANPGTVAAGGDLTGNYPNPTIAKIQGNTVSGVVGGGSRVVLASGVTGTGPAVLAASPAFTGTPTAPTPSAGVSSAAISTAAYAQSTAASLNCITGNLPTSISGTSTTAVITVSSGVATSSDGAVVLVSAGYSWAVSNGNNANGYQGGTTLPNSSTIHFYNIAIPTDITWTATFASTSLTPTLPGLYSGGKYRRIFSVVTNSSGSLIPYSPVEMSGGGAMCWLATQSQDVNTSSITSANRTLYTLSVPSLIKVRPRIRVAPTFSSAGGYILTSPDQGDVAPSTTPSTTPFSDGMDNGSSFHYFTAPDVTTNTSGQIGLRFTGAVVSNLCVYNEGWEDFRRS